VTDRQNQPGGIQISSLRVVRRGKVVIPGLSTSISPGVLTGLLGPSGCGKTTLMRSIVGVQVIESGELTVLGHPAGSPVLRRRVGYVTQEPSVYADLTARENLRFFAAVLGVGTPGVVRALEVVGLAAESDQIVEQMSGGQRSRVSLAVALLGEPDALVLDEPTVGLDPVLRRQLWQTFAALAASGVTIVVSSHVMDEAERCEHLLLMREGRLIADEPLRVLLERTGTADVESAFLALVEKEPVR
jgi:ABC-2 type transport system ATP-binding protein